MSGIKTCSVYNFISRRTGIKHTTLYLPAGLSETKWPSKNYYLEINREGMTLRNSCFYVNKKAEHVCDVKMNEKRIFILKKITRALKKLKKNTDPTFKANDVFLTCYDFLIILFPELKKYDTFANICSELMT